MRTQRLHLGGYYVRAALSLSLFLSPEPLEGRDPSRVSSPSLKLYNPMGRDESRAKNPCQWSLLTDVVIYPVYAYLYRYIAMFNDLFICKTF